MPDVDLSAVAERRGFELPATIGRGGRDDTLHAYASSLQARGVGDAEIVALVMEANATRCDPPLPERQARKCAESAIRSYEKGAGGRPGRAATPLTVPRAPVLSRRGRPDLLPDWSGVSPVAQARAWVMALFEPTECVCVVADPTLGYRGGHGGEIHVPAGMLADPGAPLLAKMLSRCGPDGLWAVVNPLDGSGMRRRGNVTSHRNLLVECDELGADEQLERICALLMNGGRGGPEAVAVTWSGGRSWHAVVRVSARDAAEYEARRAWVYALCEANHLPVDTHCGNPTRLTRLAGATRGGSPQRLAMCRRPADCWRGGPAEWAGR